MHLCQEYLIRKKINSKFPLHVSKGFVFFNDSILLSIKWIDSLSSVGYYEVSECKLEERIKILNTKNIMWEEYENHIINWSKDKKIITNKKNIFYLVWMFFLRKNEVALLESFDPLEIYPTLNKNNPNWTIDAFYFLEKIEKNQPDLFNFWNSKANEILSKYCYWLAF